MEELRSILSQLPVSLDRSLMPMMEMLEMTMLMPANVDIVSTVSKTSSPSQSSSWCKNRDELEELLQAGDADQDGLLNISEFGCVLYLHNHTMILLSSIILRLFWHKKHLFIHKQNVIVIARVMIGYNEKEPPYHNVQESSSGEG